MDAYTTIWEPATDVFVERRSRFIGAIAPVQSEEQALAFLAERRAAHGAASHNVYAFALRDGHTKRYSDDGEPQGTAGVPVLEVLGREGLTDTALVVTRYFGGVLLGAGGLVRAYAHAAKLAVDAARRKPMRLCAALSLEMGYDWYGKVAYLLPQFGAQTTGSDFGAVVRLQVLLYDSDMPAFTQSLAELTAAQVTPLVLEQRWDCMER